MSNIHIVWFRQDLRIKDNPALIEAAKNNAKVIPIYILDDENAGEWKMGAASRWWLHKSLNSLNNSLQENLRVFHGKADKVLLKLTKESNADGVYWNRCYEPWRIARDQFIKSELKLSGLDVKSFNASLLFEPPKINKKDGTPYKVFTPFYRKGCLVEENLPREPFISEDNIEYDDDTKSDLSISDLNLLPSKNWYDSIDIEWSPGEQGAEKRLNEIIKEGLENYKNGRNRPDQKFVSMLSPHLHWGEISPHHLWKTINQVKKDKANEKSIDHFLSELGWREFSHNLLYYWNDLPKTNLQEKFNNFNWTSDERKLVAWQKGMTGYPIVDAGMRQLWKTGYMHNRPRMITASFLVKNLLIHWHHGENWFWDTLVDADLANNSASWQWVSGCGADAAPYFRIFNPIIQGEKFDPNGDYVRKYVPELEGLPNKFIHKPWEASPEVLQEANVKLGKSYPHPIVDLRESRDKALFEFKRLST